jgi:chromosomal replication initiation ATPase DnaA
MPDSIDISRLSKLQLIELGLDIQHRIRQLDAAKNSVDHILLYYGVTLEEVRSRRKFKKFVSARLAIVEYLTRLGVADKVIWSFVGRDRTILYHYRQIIEGAEKYNKELFEDLQKLA